MEINKSKLKTLRENNIGIEEYLILYDKYYNMGWIPDVYKPMDIHYYKLKRLKYLDLSNSITDTGLNILTSLHSSPIKSNIADYNIDSLFEIWWENFPSDDRFQNYAATRRIKTNKKRAKQIYAKLIREDGVNPEDLLLAVNNEVSFRQKNSFKENKMTYMQGPATWLYNNSYETWLDSESSGTSINMQGKDLD